MSSRNQKNSQSSSARAPATPEVLNPPPSCLQKIYSRVNIDISDPSRRKQKDDRAQIFNARFATSVFLNGVDTEEVAAVLDDEVSQSLDLPPYLNTLYSDLKYISSRNMQGTDGMVELVLEKNGNTLDPAGASSSSTSASRRSDKRLHSSTIDPVYSSSSGNLNEALRSRKNQTLPGVTSRGAMMTSSSSSSGYVKIARSPIATGGVSLSSLSSPTAARSHSSGGGTLSCSKQDADKYFGPVGRDQMYDRYRALSRQRNLFSGSEVEWFQQDMLSSLRISASPPSAMVGDDQASQRRLVPSNTGQEGRPSESHPSSSDESGRGKQGEGEVKTNNDPTAVGEILLLATAAAVGDNDADDSKSVHSGLDQGDGYSVTGSVMHVSNYIENHVFDGLDNALLDESINHYYTQNRPRPQSVWSDTPGGGALAEQNCLPQGILPRPGTVAGLSTLPSLRRQRQRQAVGGGRSPNNSTAGNTILGMKATAGSTGSLPPLTASGGVSTHFFDGGREDGVMYSSSSKTAVASSGGAAADTNIVVRDFSGAFGEGFDVDDDDDSMYSPRTRYLGACLKAGVNPLPNLLVRRNLTTEFHLAHQAIGDTMALIMARCVSDLPQIEAIDLCDNNLSQFSLCPLVLSFQKMPCLLTLDLSENTFDRNVVSHLVTYLATQGCSIEKLCFKSVNLGDEDCAGIIRAISGNITSNISYLDLSYNHIGSSSGSSSSAAAKTTATNSSSTKSVSTSACASAAAVAIADYLSCSFSSSSASSSASSSCRLTTLLLDNNRIAGDGMVQICRSLETNTSLVHLDLSYNTLGAAGGEALGSALSIGGVSKTMQLQSLVLRAVELNSTATLTICAGLLENSIIRTINMEDNPIGEGGARALLLLPIYLKRVLNLSAKGCATSMPVYYDKGFSQFIRLAGEDIAPAAAAPTAGGDICKTHSLDLSRPFQRSVAVLLLAVIASHRSFSIQQMTIGDQPVNLVSAVGRLVQKEKKTSALVVVPETTSSAVDEEDEVTAKQATINTSILTESSAAYAGAATPVPADPRELERDWLQKASSRLGDADLISKEFDQFASRESHKDEFAVPLDKISAIFEDLGLSTTSSSSSHVVGVPSMLLLKDAFSDIDFNMKGSITRSEFVEFAKRFCEEVNQRIDELNRYNFMAEVQVPATVPSSSKKAGLALEHCRYVLPRTGLLKLTVVSNPAKLTSSYQVISRSELAEAHRLAQEFSRPEMIIHAIQYSTIRLYEAFECYRWLYTETAKKATTLGLLLPLLCSYREAQQLINRIAGSTASIPTAGLGVSVTAGEDIGLVDLQQVKNGLGNLLRPLLGNYNGYYSLDLSIDRDRQCLSLLLMQCARVKWLRNKIQGNAVIAPDHRSKGGIVRKKSSAASSRRKSSSANKSKAMATTVSVGKDTTATATNAIEGNPPSGRPISASANATVTGAPVLPVEIPKYTPSLPFACIRNCLVNGQYFQTLSDSDDAGLAVLSKMRAGRIEFDFSGTMTDYHELLLHPRPLSSAVPGHNISSVPTASDERIISLLQLIGLIENSGSGAQKGLSLLQTWSKLPAMGKLNTATTAADKKETASTADVSVSDLRRANAIASAKSEFYNGQADRRKVLVAAKLQESLVDNHVSDDKMLAEDAYFGGFIGWGTDRCASERKAIDLQATPAALQQQSASSSARVNKSSTGAVDGAKKNKADIIHTEGISFECATLYTAKPDTSGSTTGTGTGQQLQKTSFSQDESSTGGFRRRAGTILGLISKKRSESGSGSDMVKLEDDVPTPGADDAAAPLPISARTASPISTGRRSGQNTLASVVMLASMKSLGSKTQLTGRSLTARSLTARSLLTARSHTARSHTARSGTDAFEKKGLFGGGKTVKKLRGREDWKSELREHASQLMECDNDNHARAGRMIELLISSLNSVKLTAGQLALVVQCFNSFDCRGRDDEVQQIFGGSYSADLVVAFFGKLSNINDFELVMQCLGTRDAAAVECRLGPLSIFSPLRPEGVWVLDLSRPEERVIAKMLLWLSLVEGADGRSREGNGGGGGGLCMCLRILNFEIEAIVPGHKDVAHKGDPGDVTSSRGQKSARMISARGSGRGGLARDVAKDPNDPSLIERQGPRGEIPSCWYSESGLPNRGVVTVVYPEADTTCTQLTTPSINNPPIHTASGGTSDADDVFIISCKPSPLARLALLHNVLLTYNDLSVSQVSTNGDIAIGDRVKASSSSQPYSASALDDYDDYDDSQPQPYLLSQAQELLMSHHDEEAIVENADDAATAVAANHKDSSYGSDTSARKNIKHMPENSPLFQIPSEVQGKPPATVIYGDILGKVLAEELQIPALAVELKQVWTEYFVPQAVQD